MRDEAVAAAIQSHGAHGEDFADAAIEFAGPFDVVGAIHQRHHWEFRAVGVDHQLPRLKVERVASGGEYGGAAEYQQEFLVPPSHHGDQLAVSRMQLGDLETSDQNADVSAFCR